VRFETPNLNTGQTDLFNPLTAPPAATNYRESGLVLWLKADIQPPENDVCFTPESRHSRGRH
jgi:hypothetical protein